MDKTRLALIGVGMIGKRHLKAMRDVEEAELAALVKEMFGGLAAPAEKAVGPAAGCCDHRAAAAPSRHGSEIPHRGAAFSRSTRRRRREPQSTERASTTKGAQSAGTCGAGGALEAPGVCRAQERRDR